MYHSICTSQGLIPVSFFLCLRMHKLNRYFTWYLVPVFMYTIVPSVLVGDSQRPESEGSHYILVVNSIKEAGFRGLSMSVHELQVHSIFKSRVQQSIATSTLEVHMYLVPKVYTKSTSMQSLVFTAPAVILVYFFISSSFCILFLSEFFTILWFCPTCMSCSFLATWIAPFIMMNRSFLGFINYGDPEIPAAYVPLNSVISAVVLWQSFLNSPL